MKDLSIVMPVYNESECIVSVVRSWLDMLSTYAFSFELVLINDGSKDNTAEKITIFTGDPQVRVINKDNEGHGPTILKGYRLVCADAQWVFQVDSDDEIAAAEFPALWDRREEADGVFGVRQGRKQGLGRRLLSGGSRGLVRLLCGKGVSDVNVPFRLMRGDRLGELLDLIPPDTFAPNVAIAGLAKRRGWRILNMAVPHRERRTGTASLVSWGVIRMGARSLMQIGAILLKDKVRR